MALRGREDYLKSLKNLRPNIYKFGKLKESADSAVAFVVPRDIEGLTIVEARHPSDGRDMEEGFDNPTQTGITQGYLYFDNVFVPNERVFLNGEYQYTGDLVGRFTSSYRACIEEDIAEP